METKRGTQSVVITVEQEDTDRVKRVFEMLYPGGRCSVKIVITPLYDDALGPIWPPFRAPARRKRTADEDDSEEGVPRPNPRTLPFSFK